MNAKRKSKVNNNNGTSITCFEILQNVFFPANLHSYIQTASFGEEEEEEEEEEIVLEEEIEIVEMNTKFVIWFMYLYGVNNICVMIYVILYKK